MRARVLLWAAIGSWGTGFAVLSVLRHRSFATGRFDLGNMTQVVWNTAHGNFLEQTSLHGEQISRLAAHFDPILAAFAPLWWIWPSPELLLVAQSLLLALGALPVFRLALRRMRSERAALALALVYLLYPATQWLALSEFHPVALATPFLLFAFDALDRDRLLEFAVFAVLAMATKEEIGLAVAGFGIWYAFARGRRRHGAAIAATGAAVSALAILVVIPYFHGEGSAFEARYDDPVGAFFDSSTLRYLLHLGAPLLFVALLAPLALLAAVPDLLLNLVSTTSTQSSIHFHYTAGIIAPVIVATVLGAARLSRRWLAPVLVVAALVAGYKLGAVPLWGYVPGGEDFQRDAARITTHDRIAARALRLIPADETVSATNAFGAHLSARERVLSYPKLGDARWVIADETRSSYADRLAPLPTAATLARLRRNSGWKLVFQEDGVLVFQRRST